MIDRLKGLIPFLLLGATFALYWPSLDYAPFFDDTNFFERGGLDKVFLNGFSFAPRWLPYFMTAWVDLIFEDPLFVQRFLNVCLHLATAFVLHKLIRQVADHVAPHPNNRRAALAAALLFLLHPAAVYAVGYLIQRTILMATLFGLLALSAYFDGLVTRKKAFFIFSAFFYLLSSFSKEHAVTIAAAALALTTLAAPLTRQTMRRLILPAALYLGIAILVVVKMRGLLGTTYEPFAAALVHQQGGSESVPSLWALSALTQASLFFKYLGLMLMPYPGWMSIDIRVPFAQHFAQPKYLVGLFALATYALTTLVWLLKGGRRGLVGYALLAPLLLFVVEFSTVKIQEPFVLYRSYLWLAPLFIAMPVLTYRLSNGMFWSLALSVALAFAWVSSDRLQTFSSTYALWDDAAKKLPDERVLGSARVYANRGGLRMERGDFGGAVDDFTRALRADPGYREALKGRAFAHMKRGDHSRALADATALIRLDPSRRDSYIARGHVYKDQGDWRLAKADFEYGCAGMRFPAACMAVLTRDSEKSDPAAQRGKPLGEV